MDDLLDHILSSSSWSDVNSIQRSSWVGNRPTQTTVLLPSSIGVYDGDGKDSTGRMVPSSHTMESLATISSSLVACGDSTVGLDKRSVLGGVHPQEVVPNYERKPSLNGGLNSSFRSGYFPLESSTIIPTTGLSSPNLFPVFGSSSMSASLFSESSHVESNSSESSGFHQLLASGDSHSLPLIPQLWIPKSYGSDSSPSPILGQDKLHLEREHLESGESVFGYTILQPDNSSASVSTNTALATGTGGCNGTVKPRVRARRGQATDPHSIAERLRREKIAERMKNLQELVPNSNKTDKASMLDEIIEYVKFLQLQVKVLSMSRLGATGAVVPLITDDQAEGSGGLLLSPSTEEDADPCESPENIAFEQEVVKLMESNVTMAMQYLRSKGLCLMPIALAAAMSGAKALPSCSVTGDRKKPGLTQGLVGLNSSSIVSAMSHVVCEDEIVTGDNAIGDQRPASVRTDDYNGAIIKQEAGQNTTCSNRELKLESN